MYGQMSQEDCRLFSDMSTAKIGTIMMFDISMYGPS